MIQTRIHFEKNKEGLGDYFRENDIKRLMLVCGKSAHKQEVFEYLEQISTASDFDIVHFEDFEPNPTYESVVNGTLLFRKESCDGIIAVGGGSAIDVAKCIKAFAPMNGDGENGSFLSQEIDVQGIPLIAMPTTAGTGSESTRFAVIYYNGEKYSVSSKLLLPDAIILDATALKTLPIYQRKATMMDAFCHALESFWSVNSTDESRGYSRKAIQEIMDSYRGYLENDSNANAKMLMASNMAGKAIDIAKTTAGHAMCYKITGLYGLSHGHAAALCVAVLWKWMLDNIELCIDPRGQDYIRQVFKDISDNMGAFSEIEAADMFEQIIVELDLEHPHISDDEYELLADSVNVERLKNNPIRLDRDAISFLYHEISC